MSILPRIQNGTSLLLLNILYSLSPRNKWLEVVLNVGEALLALWANGGQSFNSSYMLVQSHDEMPRYGTVDRTYGRV